MGARTKLAIISLASAAVITVGAAPGVAAATGSAAPTITAPSTATEGTHFTVTAHVPKPSKATTVALQFHDVAQYSYEDTSTWTALKTVKVRGRKTIRFTTTATASKEAWFRVVVHHSHGPASRSASARVNFYHWLELADNWDYYSAGSATTLLSFEMDGQSWNGWHVLGGGDAEDHYTLPGRCTEFKGTVGLTDASGDGSTAVITLETIDPNEDDTTVYTSPTLVPGITHDVSLTLAAPYRFGIIGQDTTPTVTSGTQPVAYPAVGNPRFLCHSS